MTYEDWKLLIIESIGLKQYKKEKKYWDEIFYTKYVEEELETI